MGGLSELLADQRLRVGERVSAMAEASAGAPALIASGEVVSRAGLQAAVAAARALLSRIGVRRGDRVMIVAEDVPAAVALMLGALATDAAVIPVSASRTGWEVAALRALGDPRVVLHLPDASREAAGHAAAAGAEEVRDGVLGVLAIEAVRDCAPEEAGLPAGRQVALLAPVMRDGGRPRLAMLTHRGLAWNAALAAGERGLGEGDIVWGAGLAEEGFGTVVLPALGAGAAVLCAKGPDAGTTVIQGTPGVLARLLESGTEGMPRIVAMAGPAADATLPARLEAAYGVRPSRGYEMIEGGPAVAFVRPGGAAPALSAGPPLQGVELRVVDPAGSPMPPGEAGELLVRSAGVMAGYFRDAAATAAAFGSGRFLRTGELASRDLAGNLYLHGRVEVQALRAGE